MLLAMTPKELYLVYARKIQKHHRSDIGKAYSPVCHSMLVHIFIFSEFAYKYFDCQTTIHNSGHKNDTSKMSTITH